MSASVTAGAGFLLAVLWFDLMFDVQTFGHREPELPEDVLASIAAYYRRVTTTASPMNRLVALVMVATLAAVVVEIANCDGPRWVGWTSLALVVGAIVLAGTHTVPRAVRLGTRRDTPLRQSALARDVCRDHLVCFVAIAAVLVLQLTA